MKNTQTTKSGKPILDVLLNASESFADQTATASQKTPEKGEREKVWDKIASEHYARIGPCPFFGDKGMPGGHIYGADGQDEHCQLCGLPKHSPSKIHGRWHASRLDENERMIRDASGVDVCVLVGASEANARLIVASVNNAQALAEALRRFTEAYRLESDHDLECAEAIARKALANWEGSEAMNGTKATAHAQQQDSKTNMQTDKTTDKKASTRQPAESTQDWTAIGSINTPGAHSCYALRKVNAIAEQILFSQTATENERLLADCIIALNGGVRQ